MIKQRFAENLKKFRKSRKLTQEKLAELVGVDFRYISFLENAKSFPSCDLIEKLALALNIDSSDFFKYSKNLSRSELENKFIDSMKQLDDKSLKLLYEISKNINSFIVDKDTL